MKQHEIAKALNLSPRERSALRAVLRELERQGRVLNLRKNRWGLPDVNRFREARISVLPSGGAIATTTDDEFEEFFISRLHLGGAIHGDRVLVESVRRRRRTEWQREEARVVRVLERTLARIPGLLMRGAYYWYVIPDHPRVQENIRVTGAARGLELRERRHVVVELAPWTGPDDALSGEVVEDLGESDDPGLALRILKRNHQLDDSFEDEVERFARSRDARLSDEDLQGREDARALVTFTIDPEDARDFDDAVSLTPTESGWELGVHIADVSHFVPINSPVDREAARRGNSVYLTGGFVPMLPKYLTTDICSLNPQTDRLTYSVWIQLDREGNMLGHRVAPSVIHSRARLDYEQVQRHFDEPGSSTIPGDVREPLEAMWELTRRIRKRRMEAGALDLSMPEIKCELDADGRPIAIRRRGAPEAYHLIEEFMLLANIAVAERLAARRVPAIYRIHEEPSEDQWTAMAEALQRLGIRATPGDKHAINRICAEVAGTPREYIVNLTILRHLKRALYSERLAGHFGLGFPKYTHFTSPIRRYPDLVVHRILRAVEAKHRAPYSREELKKLAQHCSETERNADEAEEESLRQACLTYYAARLEAGQVGPYPALITGVTPRGLQLELHESLQRGMLLFRDIGDDSFVADEESGRAWSRRTRKTYRIGDSIQVDLIRVDTRRQRMDFALAESHERHGAPEHTRRRQRIR